MLYQLHWQNRADVSQTEFVAQDEAVDLDDCKRVMERFREVIESRRNECPDGWAPMVCDEGYPGFLRSIGRNVK